MRYAGIVISILLIMFLSPAAGTAADKTKVNNPSLVNEYIEPATILQDIQAKRTADSGAAPDVNTVADTNAVAEANQADTATEKFDELEEELGQLNRDGRREIKQWVESAFEAKINLAKAVQKQVISELDFIRNLAVEEGAVKTTKAIERLLESRKTRFEEITKKMEAEEEKIRQRDQDPKRGSREDRRSPRDRSKRKERDDRSRRSRSPRKDIGGGGNPAY